MPRSRAKRIDALLQALRHNMTRAKRVDAHVGALRALGDRLGEVDESRVDRTTDREIRLGRVRADAGDVHDRSLAGGKCVPGGATETNRRVELEPEAVDEVGIGQREEIAPLGRTGIVDEGIDASRLGERPLHHQRRRLGQREIHGMLDDERRAGLPRRLCGRRQFVRLPRRKAEREAVLGKPDGKGATEAAAGAGHDGCAHSKTPQIVHACAGAVPVYSARGMPQEWHFRKREFFRL